LITISHRPALFRYHQHLLRLTGEHGAWETETIGTKEQQLSLEKEIQALQNQLKDVEAMKTRLQTIDTELSLKM
jgi:ATP-binding cassette subfamily D (ALD) long-chain fatty acid import protein